MKSVAWPGTLYIRKGRDELRSIVAKLPCGGGVGVCHSSVVACHGLSESTFWPFLMLQKKLMMNGICARPRPTAAHRMYDHVQAA